MKRNATTFILVSLFFVGATVARADLDVFLNGLNVQAKADLPGFSAGLSAQFEVPLPQVEAIVAEVEVPADAFMCFQVGLMTQQPPEVVLQTYTSNKGKGWGVIAQELGVKPGSAEFHALKDGSFEFTGKPSGKSDNKGQSKDKAKGDGKGHDKGAATSPGHSKGPSKSQGGGHGKGGGKGKGH